MEMKIIYAALVLEALLLVSTIYFNLEFSRKNGRVEQLEKQHESDLNRIAMAEFNASFYKNRCDEHWRFLNSSQQEKFSRLLKQKS